MLGSGGWDEEIQNVVRRWWKRNRQQEHRARRDARTRRIFSEMAREKLDDRDKLVLGKFISLMARQHFDAGLTMGLMCRIGDKDNRGE